MEDGKNEKNILEEERLMKKIVAMIVALVMMLTLVNAVSAETDGRDWLKGNTITIVVPFKAGGSLDLMVRAFVPFWEQAADATFVVENREGVNSMLGTALYIRRQIGSGHDDHECKRALWLSYGRFSRGISSASGNCNSTIFCYDGDCLCVCHNS